MEPNWGGKEAALDLHERKTLILGIARRAFAEALLAKGVATTDDSYALFPDKAVPGGISSTCLGAVYRPFLKAKCIRKDGTTPSLRQETYAREITRWVLIDSDKCREIYGTLPKVSDGLVPATEPVQGELF